MLMLTVMFVTVCSIFEWKRICAVALLFNYYYISPPYCCAFSSGYVVSGARYVIAVLILVELF